MRVPQIDDLIRIAAISAGLIGMPRVLITGDTMHESISSTPAVYPSTQMHETQKQVGDAAGGVGEGR